MWLLLDRYLSGEGSVAEVETVRAWLADNPARAASLAELKRIREVAAHRPPARSADAAWAAVAHTAGLPLPRRRITPLATRRVTERSPRWLAAASAVFVLLASGVIIRYAAQRSPVPLEAAAPHIYVTQPGQRAEVNLVDGTRVMLAPASRLVVPGDFDITRRDVTLEGRAMLTVVHNEQKPFTVRTRSAVARDVGTRFEVSAYPEERDVIIIVAEGSVTLRDSSTPPSRAITLPRGYLGRLAPGGAATSERADTDRLTAWTDGSLEFDDTPVPAALAELARWFDLDVRIADPALAERRVTAVLRDQALPDILDVFAVGLGARVERHGRTVVFHANAARPAPQ